MVFFCLSFYVQPTRGFMCFTEKSEGPEGGVRRLPRAMCIFVKGDKTGGLYSFSGSWVNTYLEADTLTGVDGPVGI